ncbi:2'-5' RNA ligase family protein [Clostridium paridis]|uniref:2'-5' RNA ligase family protein n=1 Tax=Clostridium paridis TaxID=2803863 RepID=A0A937FFL3_9CLOT|nr:2'-5' RNA ligase family protein [Clostridium paridis]MBL4930531.1 2'-5' RNA ligase family protein [Clostridium paridis]
MRYYLVALFDDESYKQIEPIQKSISKKHRLYKNLPTLHITLEIIEDPNIEKLDAVLTKIINPYKRFKVELKDIICFNEPHKSVNLKVEKKGYISRLSRNINDTLKLHGFNVRDNIEYWDLHVSLANSNFAQREWKKNEYELACSTAKTQGFYDMAKIDRIELWKPVNNKKEMVIKSYRLKTY